MIKDYLRLIRSNHWIKNLFCFSGLVFGTISNYNDFLLPSFATFICFCFASSSVYILNDILDKEADLNHPIKKLRPIASGEVKIYNAVIIAFTLIILALILAYKINKNRKGHYILLNIDGPPEAIVEYERLMRLDEDIIRFLTIKIKFIDETPSPLMANKSDKNKVDTSIENDVSTNDTQ